MASGIQGSLWKAAQVSGLGSSHLRVLEPGLGHPMVWQGAVRLSWARPERPRPCSRALCLRAEQTQLGSSWVPRRRPRAGAAGMMVGPGDGHTSWTLLPCQPGPPLWSTAPSARSLPWMLTVPDHVGLPFPSSAQIGGAQRQGQEPLLFLLVPQYDRDPWGGRSSRPHRLDPEALPLPLTMGDPISTCWALRAGPCHYALPRIEALLCVSVAAPNTAV